MLKDDPKKEIKSISYGEVCTYVDDFTPKNLIVYRLLINNKDFEITSVQYGIAININGQRELIFFDPVFAVKELEENAESDELKKLRFRIQQVGLTTLNRVDGRANYAEIYSVDLEATEAKFQNDKAFVDALLAVDGAMPGRKEKTNEQGTAAPAVKRTKPERSIPASEDDDPGKFEQPQSRAMSKPEKIVDESKDGIKLVKYNISEDKNFDFKKIIKINLGKDASAASSGDIVRKKLTSKNSAGLTKQKEDSEAKSPLGRFIKNKSISHEENFKDREDGGSKNNDLLGIFKSASSLSEFLKDKKDKQVVLKLDKNNNS